MCGRCCQVLATKTPKFCFSRGVVLSQSTFRVVSFWDFWRIEPQFFADKNTRLCVTLNDRMSLLPEMMAVVDACTGFLRVEIVKIVVYKAVPRFGRMWLKVKYRSSGLWSEYCDSIAFTTAEPAVHDNGIVFNRHEYSFSFSSIPYII